MSEIKSNPSYRHIWSILSQSSSIDRDTNRLSLLNVLEEVTLKQPGNQEDKKKKELLPSQQPIGIPLNFQIVNLLERLDDKEKGHLIKDAELEFIDPQGKSLLKKNFEMNFLKGFKRLRYIINMNGLNITTAGTYNFHLRIREFKDSPFKEVARLPLDIKL